MWNNSPIYSHYGGGYLPSHLESSAPAPYGGPPYPGHPPPSSGQPSTYSPPSASPPNSFPRPGEQHQDNYLSSPASDLALNSVPIYSTHLPSSRLDSSNGSSGQTLQHKEGKKKALCIGINYFGQQGIELKECINDAKSVVRFLCSDSCKYSISDIVVLTDDLSTGSHIRQKPTKQNIINGMQWLVRDAGTNDTLFFHYSGHGGQTQSWDSDSPDDFDEVIYPVDFRQPLGSHLTNQVIHDILVRPLPPGCRLTAIFDSCHSGSILDIPYMYTDDGNIKELNLRPVYGQDLLTAVGSYVKGDTGGVLSTVLGITTTASGRTQKAQKKARKTKSSSANVISLNGFKNFQTSTDAFEPGQAIGAMSKAFIAAMSQNPNVTYEQLLAVIREILSGKYGQRLQLSSSHPMDTSLQFIC